MAWPHLVQFFWSVVVFDPRFEMFCRALTFRAKSPDWKSQLGNLEPEKDQRLISR
jgi:hypothetical protein